MASVAELSLVFAAGTFTALATGLGVLPFFVVRTVRKRWLVALWGVATGLMLSMSVFVAYEGVIDGGLAPVVFGFLAGTVLMVALDQFVAGYEFTPNAFDPHEYRTLVLVVGAITVHSIPEGVAVGVAFADLGREADVFFAGVGFPTLAVSMTLAIAVLNVPEGLAIAIPLVTLGVSRWKAVGWAVFSGFPQPVFALIAYAFVTTARGVLPIGLGFAAGALVYLVFCEFIPSALDHGSELPGRGRLELLGGATIGLVAVSLLVALLG